MTRFALTLLLALATTGAWAHSKSETTEPADGATVGAVETIAIRFDAPMRVTMIRLTRDGEEAAVERETGMEPVTRFVAKPGDDLAPGTYRVEWRGLAADGHPMDGTFSFTLSE